MVKDPNQKGKTGTGPKQSRLAHLFMYDAVHGEFAEGQHAFGSAAVPIDIRCLAAGLQELSDWTNAGHWTVPLVDLFRVQSGLFDQQAPRPMASPVRQRGWGYSPLPACCVVCSCGGGGCGSLPSLAHFPSDYSHATTPITFSHSHLADRRTVRRSLRSTTRRRLS